MRNETNQHRDVSRLIHDKTGLVTNYESGGANNTLDVLVNYVKENFQENLNGK